MTRFLSYLARYRGLVDYVDSACWPAVEIFGPSCTLPQNSKEGKLGGDENKEIVDVSISHEKESSREE